MLKMAAQFCSMGKTSHAHIQSIIAYEGNSLYGSTQVNTICYDGMRMCEWVCMRYLLYICPDSMDKKALYICVRYCLALFASRFTDQIWLPLVLRFCIILYYIFSILFLCVVLYISLSLYLSLLFYICLTSLLSLLIDGAQASQPAEPPNNECARCTIFLKRQ